MKTILPPWSEPQRPSGTTCGWSKPLALAAARRGTLGLLLGSGLLTLGLQLACGGGGSPAASAPAPAPTPTHVGPQEPAHIAQFTVEPAAIPHGGSATLMARFTGGEAKVEPLEVGLLASGTPVRVSPLADTVYTLTVTDQQGKSDSKTCLLKVLPAGVKVPSLLKPVITCPSKVHANQTGCVATTVDQPPHALTWTLTGGTFTSAATGPTVTFTAGPAGMVQLACTVSDGTESRSSEPATWVIEPLPAAPTGTAPTGTAPTGTAPTGTAPTGTAPTGTAPTGTAPTGTPPTGTAPTPNVPMVAAPAQVHAGQAGCQATVAPQAHCTYQWTVTGGTLTAGATAPTVTFTAAPAGTVQLSCTVTTALNASLTSPVASSLILPRPAAPALTAPATVKGGQAGCRASVALQAGVTHTWTLTGGDLTSAPIGDTVTFTPWDSGFTELTCTPANGPQVQDQGPARTVRCAIIPSAKCHDATFLLNGKPYLQLGSHPSPTNLALLWMAPGDLDQPWMVDVLNPAGSWDPQAPSGLTHARVVNLPGEPVHRVYTQLLTGLPPGGEFFYRIRLNGTVVFQHQGLALKSPTQKQRVVLAGDLISGDTAVPPRMAAAMFGARPDLLVVPGDIVNLEGHANQYRDRLFSCYNTDEGATTPGAPLMRAIPMVACLGNNDTDRVGERRGAPVAKAEPNVNGQAYYYYFSMPLNGPLLGLNESGTLGGVHFTPSTPRPKFDPFLEAAGPRYRRMGNYSFDSGNVHWVILDSCNYMFMDWRTHPHTALTQWLEEDLKADQAKANPATWKIVVFHHPLASNSEFPYHEFWMRQFLPILHTYRVDLTFSGHLHSYHRSRPLAFRARLPWHATHEAYLRDSTQFIEDTTFTGQGPNTRTWGTIPIITGAGGAHLRPKYDSGPRKGHPIPMRTDHTLPTPVVFSNDQYSYSLLEIEDHKLHFRQMSIDGVALDEFELTK